MDFKNLWLKKKVQWTQQKLQCWDVPTWRRGSTDQIVEPTWACLQSESKSNIRRDYQPGAVPQRCLNLKFSAQAFSSASAFLPQEGPRSNWKEKENGESVILFEDYQVNYWEEEKYKGSGCASHARAHSIQTALRELLSLYGEHWLPTCGWQAHSSLR